MNTIQSSVNFPKEFQDLLNSMPGTELRSELSLAQISAPENLADFAIAFSLDLDPAQHGKDSEHGSARIVILKSNTITESWGSNYRVIAFCQAPLDAELANDLFIQKVTWSWLLDALADSRADFHSASGTATKIVSTGFGELAKYGDGAKLEFRASWSPTTKTLLPHFLAWIELFEKVTGLPPVSGVESLDLKRQKNQLRH